MTTVAVATADALAGAGVRHAYTVPGESFLGLLDALEQHRDIELVSTRHESGAAFMADATGRLTGTPALALASRGPGASNLAIGVHTAMQDATPMVVLLGQVATDLRGREAFQEVDLAAMFTPLAKWAAEAGTAEEVLPLLDQALHEAVSGRPGPAVLVLPTDLVDAEVAAPPAGVPEPDARWPEPEIADVAKRLADAERPVLVAGRGVGSANADLVEVAERFGAGVYVAFRCQDRFPVDHPHFLGHLGLAVPDAVLRAAYAADLVLTVGTRWDEVSSQRYTLPGAGAAQVSLGRFDPGAGADWVAGEADALLRALLAYAPDQPPSRDWTSGHAATQAFSRPPVDVADEGLTHPTARLHPATVVSALHRAVPSDAVVTNDAGNFAAFLHRYWRFGPGVAQLAPANGAMGFAVPAAVAAACVDRSRPAVAVVGDGGALMTGQELETATRLGLDVVVVVFQNAMYGTIAMHQARELGRTAAVSIADVDFTEWARGLGAHACTVSTSAELDDALVEAFARPEARAGRRPHRSRRHLTLGTAGRAGRRPPSLSSTARRAPPSHPAATSRPASSVALMIRGVSARCGGRVC